MAGPAFCMPEPRPTRLGRPDMGVTLSEIAPEAGEAQAEQLLADAVEQPEAEGQPGEAVPDTGEAKAESPKDWEAEAAKWRSLARKHETNAKANADAARKYAEYEDSQKTEQQKLIERLEAAERERDEERRGRARLMAAAAYSIPASLLDRIGGATEDEINESAQALAQEIEAEVARRLAATPPPPAPEPERRDMRTGPSRPVESLTPGAMPADERPVDGNDFIRRMAGRT